MYQNDSEQPYFADFYLPFGGKQDFGNGFVCAVGSFSLSFHNGSQLFKPQFGCLNDFFRKP